MQIGNNTYALTESGFIDGEGNEFKLCPKCPNEIADLFYEKGKCPRHDGYESELGRIIKNPRAGGDKG